MIEARQMYCSRCGRSFTPGEGPVSVFVNGVAACPECGGAGFVAAECKWCATVFLWSQAGGDACPLCTHAPYWQN